MPPSLAENWAAEAAAAPPAHLCPSVSWSRAPGSLALTFCDLPTENSSPRAVPGDV